ncbi:nucleoside recognition protein [Lacrimispora saccharolytica]|uniref:Nucleoside recognition domain-containing protein n=1 Tax=Lacrimispora saccharolytica (strain ATCC 35040 / DSM 2544 / NRCC 2533 / WM1) TaxID=610130 RepID=D9R0Z9_LACSW|nr:nucleoside recognition protein [Lacrimispora saccharolytica]ADL04546.1 nucleoside recognition domain-containing protein [[Clostridium] saccharolyticum WM1]QRV21203.1 nucleoside recognition protein [Lacrimispora saccharolytica]
MKKSFFRLLSVAALVLLLRFPSTAFEGARNGLVLWGSVVVPTLLPFMICSNVIVALNAIRILIFPVRGILHRFFCLSDAGSYTLVSGLLCGYPMGARTCSDFMDNNLISEKEGKYLLAICNHPSPMFLLGYTAANLSPSVPVWLILACVYLPIIPLSFAARIYYGIHGPAKSLPIARESCKSFDESLMDSCEVMVKIGGYIMLFSILALYITTIPINVPQYKAVILGFVEITTGIKAVSQAFSGMSGGLWIGVVTAFGGLSGIFQTKSVIKNAGLSIRHYVTWKVLHSILTIILFILLSRFPLFL